MEAIISLLVGVITFIRFYNRLIEEEKKIDRVSTIISKIQDMETSDTAKWRDLKEVKDDLKELFKELKVDVNNKLESFGDKLEGLGTALGALRKNMRRLKYQFILVILLLTPNGVIGAIDLYKKIMAAIG